MNTIHPQGKRRLRVVALLLALLLTLPFFSACSSQKSANTLQSADDTRVETVANTSSTDEPKVKKGLTFGQKVALLTGAAALYYLYNHHKNAQGEGAEGQYYLSKNGRVYYRDAQHQVHWVTPPPEGIQVPEEEAQDYRDFQGYNNSPTGRDLTNLQPAPVL